MAEECEQSNRTATTPKMMKCGMGVYCVAIALMSIGCGVMAAVLSKVFTCETDLTFLSGIAVGLIVFAYRLGRIAYGNYMRAWRIAEMYRHKRFVVATFNAQFKKLQNCSSCEVLNPPNNNDAAIRKNITASRADYKLSEMLIEVLSKDPLKNFGS